MKFGISTFVTDEGSRRGPWPERSKSTASTLCSSRSTRTYPSAESPPGLAAENYREGTRTLDPFITLTAAAAATERLLLGTGVALVVERIPSSRPRKSRAWTSCPGGE